MKSQLTYGLQALGVIAAFLFADLIIAPRCHDRSYFTNKFLIFDYVNYAEASPVDISNSVADPDALPGWLRLPRFEILGVSDVTNETAAIHLRNAERQTVTGLLQVSIQERQNGDSLVYVATDESGALLFEYRLTLQPVADRTRITHLSISPMLKSEIIRLGPAGTADLRRRLLDTHSRVEARLRDEF